MIMNDITEHYLYKEFESYLDVKDKNKNNYIVNRVIGQIIWYDKKSISYQHIYKKMSIISIILTSCIPVFTLFTRYKYGIIASVIIAILSACSSVIISISSLCEYQKLWIQYRSICEMLKSILHRYFMQLGEFSNNDACDNLKVLAFTCEEYMTKEYQLWTNQSRETDKEK